MFSSDEMREVYQHTRIVKKPTYGIVSGYHELPYVCLGERLNEDRGTLRVRGKVHVSPRFLIRPSHYEPSYGEIFGEDNVDAALTGRLFGFLGFRGKPVECTSDHLEVMNLEAHLDRVLAETLDELERHEDIVTGVIISPNSRFFPVSVERFIASILDDEFSL
jgi:hypothetical protein